MRSTASSCTGRGPSRALFAAPPRPKSMTTVDRKKLHALHERESQRFVADHPNSAALYQRAQSSLLGGVPMNWMKKWAGAFPIFVKSAKGAHFTDVDNR